MSANLLATLYDGAPSDAAFRLCDRIITRAEARETIARWACVLAAHGVGRGDRVSFKLAKSIEVVFLTHATFQLGAIIHPLNTAYTDRETDALVTDVAPRLFVCERTAAPAHEELAQLLGATLVSIDDLAAVSHVATPLRSVAAVADGEVAALLYTSGTTGRPKGAEITHRNLAESARALAEVWRIMPRDVLLHVLPLFHAHGLLTSIDATLAGGGSVRLAPTFDAEGAVAAFTAATIFMGVPTHYARMLENKALSATTAANMRLFISGSAPLPPTIAAAFAARTGHTILERYGATETAIVTALPAGTKDRTGWVGWALPGVDIRVRTARGDVATHAARGDLETRGHNVCAGYWRQPDITRAALSDDGWFQTGDIAEIDAGGCVRLLGRSKDLIISGGLNVYPLEVEAILDRVEGIGETAVFGVPHPDFGEAVVGVATVPPGASFDEAAVLKSARDSLAAFKVPKRLIPIADIPRTIVGKVSKADLRARYADLFQPQEAEHGPET